MDLYKGTNIRLMPKDTYTMVYICGNCKTNFERELPKGLSAFRHGGKCPYCGIEDGTLFNSANFYRPEGK